VRRDKKEKEQSILSYVLESICEDGGKSI